MSVKVGGLSGIEERDIKVKILEADGQISGRIRDRRMKGTRVTTG